MNKLPVSGFIFFFATFSLVHAHVLECYVCTTIERIGNDTKLNVNDPCWDPTARQLTLTKCPQGHTCHKQITILYSEEKSFPYGAEKYF